MRKMTKAKPRTAAEPRVGLVCDQCRSEASFIKVFHIPKKAPQYLQSRILRRVLGPGGGNLAGADTSRGAARIPSPLKLVHCKTELFYFTFGFAVCVGKTENNCNKKTNVENGKGRQHSSLQHNRWNISGIRFKATGVGPLPPELARAHGVLPLQSLPQLTAPSTSPPQPSAEGHCHPSTAWGQA